MFSEYLPSDTTMLIFVYFFWQHQHWTKQGRDLYYNLWLFHVMNGNSKDIEDVEIQINICFTNNLETKSWCTKEKKHTEHGFGKYIV